MDSNGFPRALHDLEQDFAQLASDIPEGAQKKALSVLHGIVMEVWRSIERNHAPVAGVSTQDVADLWRGAPAMEGEAVNEPLPVGSEAPDFALPDASGNTVRLRDFRGRPVVLVFYPLDWSPGCSQQLDLYQQELDEFSARGAQVLGISVDSIYSHGAWAAVRGVSIPLLSDFHPKGKVARRYLDRNGIAYEYVDLDVHPEARSRLEWMTGGRVYNPVVYVGGEVLVQPTISELQWALNRSGQR